jgi:hypothetical protein
LFLIGLTGWLSAAALTFHYQSKLPRHPDAATGNIYPLNVHGIVVYQTRDERNRLDALQYSSIALAGLAMSMMAIHQKKFPPPPDPPKFGRVP